MSIGGDQLLNDVETKWPKLGQFLRGSVVAAIENLARHTGASPVGEIARPAAPTALNVKVSGEIAHFTINDPQELQRGAQYHIEIADNPQFSHPHVEHLGPSRGRFITLPTKDDSGGTHNWHARAFVQYQGSQPSPVTPTAKFTMAGTTQLTPLPSTGSGTAAADGSQGGWGLGKTLTRSAPAPKRAVNG